MKRPVALALAVVLAAGCTPEKADPDARQKKVDDVALAFERYVHRYYETRLAAEKSQPGPSLAARMKAREDLREALRALGIEAPADGEGLKGAVEAARAVLVAHDYIFLPFAGTDEDRDEDQGIAFAHVRRREPARSMDLWGNRVAYKLVIYEPLIFEYATWKARVLKDESVMYSPGRVSIARETIYIDHAYCVKRAQAQPIETQGLGLEGILREVELRQAAYLMFGRTLTGPGDLEKLHERVLWTAVRHGDPDIAWRDVNGLAAAADGCPPELRAAARSVRARLPKTLDGLPTKEARAAALRSAAEEAWKNLG